MIFILHYILLGAAMPTIIVFVPLYLREYSTASMSEIGALLNAPALVAILLKPIVGGFADRYQAHKLCLIGALACTAVGYGSLTVGPFFPHFLKEHDRLAWYCNVLSVALGAAGSYVAWSLGDAVAINGAEMAGVSWGSYRVWTLVASAPVGPLAGFLNETNWLPRHVPALLLLIILLSSEIILLALWPNKYFVMYGNLKEKQGPPNLELEEAKGGKVLTKLEENSKKRDTQVVLLKTIAKRDKLLVCYAALFAIFGFAWNCQYVFFYMYLQQLCENSVRFSVVSGGMMLTRNVAEIVALLLTPALLRRFGSVKILTTIASAYCLCQLYHGTLLPYLSLYYAIPIASIDGLSSGVVCSLIAVTGLDIVNRIENYLPELIDRKLVEPDADIIELKSRVRATMYALLSAATHGLGGGLGMLLGGVVLDHFSFPILWRLIAILFLSTALIFPLAERWCSAASKQSARIK